MILNGLKNYSQLNFTANQMPKDCADYIDKKLKSAKTVDIFCHLSSDEDTFNSAKTMYSYLKRSGVAPRIIVSGGTECFEFNKDKYNILQYDQVTDKTDKADVALCLDFSSPNRVLPNVYKHLQKYGNKNILGFDHHNDLVKITPNYTQIAQSYESVKKMPKIDVKNYYIDSSAKSNCAIISRFFDAISHKTNKDEEKSLFCGMFDDMSKSGAVKISKNGKLLIKNLDDKGNSKSVINKIFTKLSKSDLSEVLEHFSSRSNLNEHEKAFKNSLLNKIKYSDNGKFAYIEISPEDEDWIKIGKDTEKTKTILKEFRLNSLKNENIQAAAVFYPTNTNGVFKMSIHSKKDYAKQIISKIQTTTCPELIAGGHDERSGGTLTTYDKQKYHDWVNLFKKASDEIIY